MIQSNFNIKKKKRGFAMVDIELIEAPYLSWAAKAMLIYMLSRPDNWKIHMTDLVNRSTNGIESVKTIMKELRASGHVVLNKVHGENGKLKEFRYDVYEERLKTPIPEIVTIKANSEPEAECQPVENRSTENPQAEMTLEEIKLECEYPTNYIQSNYIQSNYIQSVISQEEYEELTDGQTDKFIQTVDLVLEVAEEYKLQVTPDKIIEFFDYWQTVPKGNIKNYENYIKKTIHSFFHSRI